MANIKTNYRIGIAPLEAKQWNHRKYNFLWIGSRLETFNSILVNHQLSIAVNGSKRWNSTKPPETKELTLGQFKDRNHSFLVTIRNLEYKASQRQTGKQWFASLIQDLKKMAQFNRDFIEQESFKKGSRYKFKEEDFQVPKKVKRKLTIEQQNRLEENRVLALEAKKAKINR